MLPVLVCFQILVFVGDVVAGAQVSLWCLFAIPVALAGIALGGSTTARLAAFSAALIVGADLLGGHPYTSALFLAISEASRIAALLLIAFLAHLARGHVHEIMDGLFSRSLAE